MRKTTYVKGQVVKYKGNSYRVSEVFTDSPKDLYLLLDLKIKDDIIVMVKDMPIALADELSKDYMGDVLYGQRNTR